MGIFDQSCAQALKLGIGSALKSDSKPIWFPSFNSATDSKPAIRNQKMYKVSVALLLGFIGSELNLNTPHLNFSPFESILLPGLIFPMIVTQIWGWPYGLLSATPNLVYQAISLVQNGLNSLEPFVALPALILWILWHGWCATHHRKNPRPLLNPYIAELPYRICYTLMLYALIYGLLQWKPQAWITVDAVGPPVFSQIHFIVVEQTIFGYFVLLMTDVLLNLRPIRYLFGLKRPAGRMPTRYVFSTALFFGLLFWIIDGLVDYYKFQEHLRFLLFRAPENLLDSIIFNVSLSDLFVRTVFLLSCLTGGVLVYCLLRKQLGSEAALKQSEIRYRRLYETMWDAFVQVDMAGRIIDCNHVFQKLLGYSKRELLEMIEADLTPSKWHAANAKRFSEQIIPKGRSDVYEKEYRRADGTIFSAELRTFLITDDGHNPTGTWSIVRDVTERIKMEREKENAIIALEHSNEDLKQFAYVASHDLQEPLRMVTSYVQLLKERYHDRLDEKGHRYIHYAVDGASRMQTLIRDLLALSRVETHARAFKMVDTCKAMASAVANLKIAIDESGGVITTEDLPWVQADQVQLSLLFQNLISNGIKFHKKSLAPQIHVSACRQNDDWCFSIQDNGIGIRRKYKKRVFEIFQRLHTRDEFPGTGIGLALCKRIIERHDGHIWLDSTLGQGTTFYFTLPASRREAKDDDR